MTEIKRYAAYNPETFEFLGFYSEGRKDMPSPSVEVTLEDIEYFNEHQCTHIDVSSNPVSSYRVEPVKTEEDLYEDFKTSRTLAVSNIVVEVDGMVFDGDEVSQGRMSRAIISLDDQESIYWTLNDNTTVLVTKEQLKTALRLSGAEQTALWTQTN